VTPVDVLVVSLGSTAGLRASDAELTASIQRAGASAVQATAAPQRDVRTLALTDLVWARAARAAAQEAIARSRPRAVVYSTITAALLWPRPGAIRFDSLAAVNRRGRHGVWQRPLERGRLREAPLLVPVSAAAAAQAPPGAAPAVVVGIPVEPSVSHDRSATRDIAAITYAGDPGKKDLARILKAWRSVRRPHEELVVAGLEGAAELDLIAQEGVRSVGRVEPAAFRALLRRARVFVAAPRFEDYGIAQLEALADGCMLVTAPAPGPYVALPIARELDPRLVDDDLATALRTALDAPADGYAGRAADALAPFRRAAIDRIVAGELLPRLLG
jgi:hypothetical protein